MPTISGTVKDPVNANVARVVRAYVKSSGQLQATTVSNASTGAFSLTVPYSGAHTVVACDAIPDPDCVLLMPMTGPDLSTNFIELVSGRASTAFYNAKISTTRNAYTNGTGSLSLDGTGDFIEIPTTSAFIFGTADFSIEAWVYVTASPNNKTIFSTGTYSSANSVSLMIDNTLKATAWLNGSDNIVSSVSLSLNTWAHVALVRASGVFTIYINGVPRGTYTATLTLNQTLPFIGTTTGYNDSGPSFHFCGNINDLRVRKAATYTANFSGSLPSAPLSCLTSYGNNALVFDDVIPV